MTMYPCELLDRLLIPPAVLPNPPIRFLECAPHRLTWINEGTLFDSNTPSKVAGSFARREQGSKPGG